MKMLIDKVKAIYYEEIVKLVKTTPDNRALGCKIRRLINVLEAKRPSRRKR